MVSGPAEPALGLLIHFISQFEFCATENNLLTNSKATLKLRGNITSNGEILETLKSEMRKDSHCPIIQCSFTHYSQFSMTDNEE